MIALLLASALAFPAIDLSKLDEGVRKPARNFYQHTPMAPACSPGEVTRLEVETRKAVGDDTATQAWRLAFTVLCGSSRASRRYLLRHTPERFMAQVFPSAKASNDVDREWRPRRDAAFRRGYAWDARVERKGRDFNVDFHSDEMCAGGFTLRQVGGIWWFVETYDACD
jgi:hypothetical protein